MRINFFLWFLFSLAISGCVGYGTSAPDNSVAVEKSSDVNYRFDELPTITRDSATKIIRSIWPSFYDKGIANYGEALDKPAGPINKRPYIQHQFSIRLTDAYLIYVLGPAEGYHYDKDYVHPSYVIRGKERFEEKWDAVYMYLSDESESCYIKINGLPRIVDLDISGFRNEVSNGFKEFKRNAVCDESIGATDY